jgi:hypothetical protein
MFSDRNILIHNNDNSLDFFYTILWSILVVHSVKKKIFFIFIAAFKKSESEREIFFYLVLYLFVLIAFSFKKIS